MDNPKVSIIIPVYNVEKYLKKCLDSVVNQTLKDIEIIVVNDGSPDNSQKIIDEYAKKYSQIASYTKKNGGLSDARNYGIKKSKGEYLAFIDSDDFIDHDMIKKMYNKAVKENLDIVVCNSVEVYENGLKREIKSNLKMSNDTVKNYLISPPMACTRIYKRSLFDSFQFKKGILYEDLELTPKFVTKTKHIGFIDEGLYYYFQRTGSIMKQSTFNNKLLCIFDVLDSLYQVLYKEYYDELEYLYITHLLRTATLRFLEYKNTREYLNRIVDIMKDKFPTWRNNKYYKNSSRKLQIICRLAYNKNYTLLKIIKYITKK